MANHVFLGLEFLNYLCLLSTPFRRGLEKHLSKHVSNRLAAVLLYTSLYTESGIVPAIMDSYFILLIYSTERGIVLYLPLKTLI